MKVVLAAAFAVLSLATPVAAHAAGVQPPTEFGSDWDDPRTAAPPVARPDAPNCTTTIVDTQFRDFTPYTGRFAPPCRGPWQKVVLTMDGAIAGRQYDRLGYLKVGGVIVFKTSTPEPSPAGIRWTVEKDLTDYAGLLTTPQPVEMLIGNVVDDTYTGVLDIRVRLTFYQGRAPQPAVVLPVSAAIPRNTERLVADVYATGSGGGCEEFWYLTTPTGVPYSCPAGNGPYREVQITVDGRLAGIAAPYPHIYTGGWSNPFLWYVVPAPRAFDIKPIRYDLTPFAGLLTDGRPHDIGVSVVGVPAGQSGWDVPTTLLAWRDPHRTQVTGALLHTAETPLTNTPDYSDHTLTLTGAHSFTATGYLDTSRGRVTTRVSRALTNTSTHRWNADESQDALQAVWTDDTTVTTGRSTATTDLRYGVDGAIVVTPDNRLTTTMSLLDAAAGSTARLTDTWTGTASWTLGVPREDRHATGTSTERYRLGPCYDRTITTVNGTVTSPLGAGTGPG
jgi:hypothetical protein